MSFDGILLQKLKNEFEILKTGRISKISESGDTDFIFTIRAIHINYNLMLSFSSDFARIHLAKRVYDAPMNPKSFTMFLRKHIEGYFILDIKTYHCDRVIYFILQGYNEMQDLNKKYLICEIMGRYSNLILTDENFKIIEALKHDGVGEYNRTILPNAIYEFPSNNKLNPLDYTYEELTKIIKDKKLNNPKDYMNTFNGVSLNLAYPIFEIDMHEKAFYDYLHLAIKPATFINFKGKLDFYYHPFNYKIVKEYDSISAMLEDYYYYQDLQAKVKHKTNDIGNFINKQIAKNEKKLIKLKQELAITNQIDEIKLYGELLLSYPNLKEKLDKITLLNYYDNKEITIPLEKKYSVIENSNRYFKKYQKAKNSIHYINEQINLANQELEYFNILKYQLTNASLNEALEIEQELIDLKYIFKRNNKPSKKSKPKILQYIFNDSIISVGKNNLQNDYITNKLAKPNDFWFHVKDAPGSHVVIHKSTLTEQDIRITAMIAAKNSSMSLSSSICVDYTQAKYIKKIPGRANCFVSYTHQKSIYIDIDETILANLKVKK